MTLPANRSKRARCAGTNAEGESCGMAPGLGSPWCFAHDPKRGRDRAKARKLGGTNRRAAASGQPVPLRTVGDIQAQLEQAVGDVLELENSARRAHALGSLLTLAMRALEVGELEQRIDALEQQYGALARPRLA